MKYDRITAALAALPGGFSADWAMPWNSSDGKTVITLGPDWTDGIPQVPGWDRAREDAADYSADVEDALIAALEAEQRCRKALEEGDLEAARGAANYAADQEWQFGDCPTYRPLLAALGIE